VECAIRIIDHGNPAGRLFSEDEIKQALIRRELVESVVLLMPPPLEGETSTTKISSTTISHQHTHHSTGKQYILDNRTATTQAWLEAQDGHLLYVFTAPLPLYCGWLYHQHHRLSSSTTDANTASTPSLSTGDMAKQHAPVVAAPALLLFGMTIPRTCCRRSSRKKRAGETLPPPTPPSDDPFTFRRHYGSRQ
jgi:hypothetical protein